MLYSDGITDVLVADALQGVLNAFFVIRETDSRLPRPIINRDLIGIAVALKPGHPAGSAVEKILAVGQIGQIDDDWLNQSQDSGDNTAEHGVEQYRFIFDVLAAPPSLPSVE